MYQFYLLLIFIILSFYEYFINMLQTRFIRCSPQRCYCWYSYCYCYT